MECLGVDGGMGQAEEGQGTGQQDNCDGRGGAAHRFA